MNAGYQEAPKGLRGVLASMPVEVPSIPRALSVQEKELQALSESLTQLQSRLQPVSRREPTCGVEKCPEEQPQGVAGTLENSNRTISMFTARVQEMIRLLEV